MIDPMKLKDEDVECDQILGPFKLILMKNGTVLLAFMLPNIPAPMAPPITNTKEQLEDFISCLAHFHQDHLLENEKDAETIMKDLINRSKLH